MAERRWAEQFVGMLEALRMPALFQQGRRYARSGHVRQLNISASLVTALVFDDDGQTYRAKIAVRTFSGGDWHRIERALSEQAIHAARLLAGQLPDDVDTLLAGFGLSLFPESFSDMAMDCSCSGWQRPCAHLAAATYALATSFDADPFGILTWRGRGREELLDRIRGLRGAPVVPASVPVEEAPSLSGFWTGGPRLAPLPRAVAGRTRRPDALLDQLEPLRLTAGRHEVQDILATAYRTIAEG